MNAFQNFKTFLRSIKDEANRKISISYDQISKCRDQYLDECEKHRQKAYRNINDILEVQSVWKQKAEDLYKNTVDLYAIVSITEGLIRSFSSDRCVSSVQSPLTLISITNGGCYKEFITIEEANMVLGAAWAYLKAHPNDIKEEEQLLACEIGKFYDVYGNFIPGYDPEELVSAYKALCFSDEHFIKGENSENFKNQTMDELIEKLRDLYKAFNETIKNAPEKEKEEVKPKKNPKMNELKRFYSNGKLHHIPEDLQYFANLLEECQISDAEKRYIYTLIDEALNASKIVEDKNNIIIFKGANGNLPFLEKLSLLDDSLKEEIMTRFKALKENNKEQFVPVEGFLSVYYIATSGPEVVFAELDDGIYLVLDLTDAAHRYEVASTMYEEKNEAYINSLYELLLDDDEKEKLLIDSEKEIMASIKKEREKE